MADGEIEEGGEEGGGFVVLKVVQTKIKNGQRFYKVRWGDSWEPEENLLGCQELIDVFWEEEHEKEKNKVLVKSEDENKSDRKLRKRKRKSKKYIFEKEDSECEQSQRNQEKNHELGSETEKNDTNNLSKKQASEDEEDFLHKRKKKFIRPIVSDDDADEEVDTNDKNVSYEKEEKNSVPSNENQASKADNLLDENSTNTTNNSQLISEGVDTNVAVTAPEINFHENSPSTSEPTNNRNTDTTQITIKPEPLSENEEESFQRTAKIQASFTIRKYIEREKILSNDDTVPPSPDSADQDFIVDETQSDSDISIPSNDNDRDGAYTPTNFETQGAQLLEHSYIGVEPGSVLRQFYGLGADSISHSFSTTATTTSSSHIITSFQYNNQLDKNITVKQEPIELSDSSSSSSAMITIKATVTDSLASHTLPTSTMKEPTNPSVLWSASKIKVNIPEVDYNQLAWRSEPDVPLNTIAPVGTFKSDSLTRLLLDVIYLFCSNAKDRVFSRDRFLEEIHEILCHCVFARTNKLYEFAVQQNRNNIVMRQFIEDQCHVLHLYLLRKLAIDHPNVVGMNPLPPLPDEHRLSEYAFNLHWNLMLTDPLMVKHLKLYATNRIQMTIANNQQAVANVMMPRHRLMFPMRHPVPPGFNPMTFMPNNQNTRLTGFNIRPNVQNMRLTGMPNPTQVSVSPLGMLNNITTQMLTTRLSHPQPVPTVHQQAVRVSIQQPVLGVRQATVSADQPCIITGVRSLNPNNSDNRQQKADQDSLRNLLMKKLNDINVPQPNHNAPLPNNISIPNHVSLPSIVKTSNNSQLGQAASSPNCDLTENLANVNNNPTAATLPDTAPLPNNIPLNQVSSDRNLLDSLTNVNNEQIVPPLPKNALLSNHLTLSKHMSLPNRGLLDTLTNSNNKQTEQLNVNQLNAGNNSSNKLNAGNNSKEGNVSEKSSSADAIITNDVITHDNSSTIVSRGSCSLKPILIEDEVSVNNTSSVSQISKETNIPHQQRSTNSNSISNRGQCRKTTSIACYLPTQQEKNSDKGLSFVPDTSVPSAVQAYISKHYDAIMHYVADKRDMVGSKMLVHKNGSVEVKLINGKSVQIRYKDIIKYRHESRKALQANTAVSKPILVTSSTSTDVSDQILVTSPNSNSSSALSTSRGTRLVDKSIEENTNNNNNTHTMTSSANATNQILVTSSTTTSSSSISSSSSNCNVPPVQSVVEENTNNNNNDIEILTLEENEASDTLVTTSSDNNNKIHIPLRSIRRYKRECLKAVIQSKFATIAPKGSENSKTNQIENVSERIQTPKFAVIAPKGSENLKNNQDIPIGNAGEKDKMPKFVAIAPKGSENSKNNHDIPIGNTGERDQRNNATSTFVIALSNNEGNQSVNGTPSSFPETTKSPTSLQFTPPLPITSSDGTLSTSAASNLLDIIMPSPNTEHTQSPSTNSLVQDLPASLPTTPNSDGILSTSVASKLLDIMLPSPYTEQTPSPCLKRSLVQDLHALNDEGNTDIQIELSENFDEMTSETS